MAKPVEMSSGLQNLETQKWRAPGGKPGVAPSLHNRATTPTQVIPTSDSSFAINLHVIVRIGDLPGWAGAGGVRGQPGQESRRPLYSACHTPLHGMYRPDLVVAAPSDVLASATEARSPARPIPRC
jgi:hypothetical protein